jgi:hypothetical protein
MRSQQSPGPQGPYAPQPPADQWQPPGGPYQPQGGPAYQPPPPPRKRRRGLKVTLAFLGGVFALIVIGSVASALGGSNSATSTGTGTNTGAGTGNSPAAQSAGSSAAGIGDPVRDGKFQFTVVKVTHAKSVGDTSIGLGDTAQGRYTIVTLKVTNIGSESQTLDDSSQYLYDAHGKKFSADSAVDIDLSGANGQGSTWLNDINPGNTVRGKIAFDMPARDKAVKIELHDSMFSNGATVTLR